MRYSSDNLDILEMVDLFNEWNIDDVLKEDSRTIEELKFSTTTMEQYKKILDKKVYEMLTLVVEAKHLIENDKDGSNLNKIRTAGVKIGNFINQQFKIKDAKLDRLEFVNVNDFNTGATRSIVKSYGANIAA